MRAVYVAPSDVSAEGKETSEGGMFIRTSTRKS